EPVMITKNTAIDEIKHLAVNGDTEAQFRMGKHFDIIDLTQALIWYKKAANAGHTAAQRQVGLIYAEGRGIPQNYIEAARWYEMAGDPSHAQYLLKKHATNQKVKLIGITHLLTYPSILIGFIFEVRLFVLAGVLLNLPT